MPTLDVTHWTDKTELFMEYPPLVTGRSALFAVQHLWRAAGFWRELDLRLAGINRREVREIGQVGSAFRNEASPEPRKVANLERKLSRSTTGAR